MRRATRPSPPSPCTASRHVGGGVRQPPRSSRRGEQQRSLLPLTRLIDLPRHLGMLQQESFGGRHDLGTVVLKATDRLTRFRRPGKGHLYDQIAWFTGTSGMPALTLQYTGAGGFDFVPHLMTRLTKTELSWRISDHYPLWAEFRTR